jgi:hypothetical protein
VNLQCMYFKEYYISPRRVCVEEATTLVLPYGRSESVSVCPQHARRILAANRKQTAQIIRESRNV